ncbi:UNVERIFIED_CONTAM: hypothetical protein ABID98_005630 [Brevibacillus sp. OAP136]
MNRMTLFFAWIVSGLLTVIGIMHVYWCFGGKTGTKQVIPTKNGQPLFKPGKIGTALVALLAWAGAFLLLVQAHVLEVALPAWIPTWICWAMVVALYIRVIGDFRFIGISKRYKTSLFAKYDSMIYVPLCFTMASLALIVMLRT